MNFVDIVFRDKRHIWHPFTQALNAPDPICIARGEGTKLFDTQGKVYLDMISSWWVNTHGHANPQIAQAIAYQAQQLEQVIFADFTHAPAVELASSLSKLLPGDLNRVFFSDNGSTAVETALKMALHYWRNKGEKQRTRFAAFDGSYHGDTVGAMAAGKNSGFFEAYADMLFPVMHLPFPETWDDDAQAAEKEREALSALDQMLDEYGATLAAVIFEPLVQGARGMRMCSPSFIREAVKRIQERDILVIFDEVMTGFGRTGRMFASEKCAVVPDIICLAKGLSGGFLPISATVCRDGIFEAFLGESFAKALAHGHSFTANPLACAAANANLRLFREQKTIDKIGEIEKWHKATMAHFKNHPAAERLRVMGSISALNIKTDEGYDSLTSRDLKEFFLSRGLVIRPLGNVLYLLPPYCVEEAELKQAYDAIFEALQMFVNSATPLVA